MFIRYQSNWFLVTKIRSGDQSYWFLGRLDPEQLVSGLIRSRATGLCVDKVETIWFLVRLDPELLDPELLVSG